MMERERMENNRYKRHGSYDYVYYFMIIASIYLWNWENKENNKKNYQNRNKYFYLKQISWLQADFFSFASKFFSFQF